MELSYLLFTGSLSGLVSILGHSVVWSLIEVVRPKRPGVPAGQLFDPQIQISEALLHMLTGIGLGFLFWLSWGLAAIVDVSWWIRGLAFGGLTAVLILPPLLNMRFARRLDSLLVMLFASRWLTTCIVAGLTCAWSWERSV
jgi:hypothetical protein